MNATKSESESQMKLPTAVQKRTEMSFCMVSVTMRG